MLLNVSLAILRVVMNTFIELIIPVSAISNMHSTISISERISSSSRLVRGWMRSAGGARKGVGAGNVRCRDGLPSVVGLPGLAL